MFTKWLRQGLLSFGRPDTEGDRYAVSVGLKKRPAAQVTRDFFEDIKPAIREARLELPTPGELDVELPRDLAWRL